jgi:hypothetical protein
MPDEIVLDTEEQFQNKKEGPDHRINRIYQSVIREILRSGRVG